MPPAILRALVLYVCQRGAYAPRYDYAARMRVLKYRGASKKPSFGKPGIYRHLRLSEKIFGTHVINYPRLQFAT